VAPVQAAMRKRWPMGTRGALSYKEVQDEAHRGNSRSAEVLDACCVVFHSKSGMSPDWQEMLSTGKKCFGRGVEPVWFACSPGRNDLATFVFKDEDDRNKALQLAQKQFPEKLAKTLDANRPPEAHFLTPKERTCYFHLQGSPLSRQALLRHLQPWSVEGLKAIIPRPDGLVVDGYLRFPSALAMNTCFKGEKAKPTTFQHDSQIFWLELWPKS